MKQRKLKVIINQTINKYELIQRPVEPVNYSDFENDNLKIYYNLVNSGIHDFSNFLEAEALRFNGIDDIKKMQGNFERFAVVSFYRENGYNGVYVNGNADALKVKCNNWVHGGRDGYMFILYYNGSNELKLFVRKLAALINEGWREFVLFDNEECAIIDTLIDDGLLPGDGLINWLLDNGFNNDEASQLINDVTYDLY